jgi:hypothetical protein
MTLEDRVYAMYTLDCGPTKAAHENMQSKIERDDNPLTEYELDCRDWGIIMGLAFAVARGEDPYEPEGKVSDRATEATRKVWGRVNSLSGVKRGEAVLA